MAIVKLAKNETIQIGMNVRKNKVLVGAEDDKDISKEYIGQDGVVTRVNEPDKFNIHVNFKDDFEFFNERELSILDIYG